MKVSLQEESAEEVGSYQLSESKRFSKKTLTVLLSGTIFVFTIILGVVFQFGDDVFDVTHIRKSTEKSIEKIDNKFSYPQKNIIIFTRCFGGDRQFTHCKLYSSSLKESEEQLVYTFDFPDTEQTTFEAAFTLIIDGVSNKKVVYTQGYWEKEGDVTTNTKKVGYVDLLSGINTEIFAESTSNVESSVEHDVQHLEHLFVDEVNERVYYTTQAYQSPIHQIVQYNLSNDDKVVLADNNNLDFPHIVLGATKEGAFLSPRLESPYSYLVWNKTLDLQTKDISSVSESKITPVFDSTGEYVAYVKRNEISGNIHDLSLIVAKTDGGGESLIRTINNTGLPDTGVPYSKFSQYYFNTYGNVLSYSIHSEPGKNSQEFSSTSDFLSILKVREEAELERNGIQIAPLLENVETIFTVEPAGTPYRWVKYKSFSGPFVERNGGKIFEGVIYESEGGLFFNPYVHRFNNYLVDLIDGRSIVGVRASNVYVVPN